MSCMTSILRSVDRATEKWVAGLLFACYGVFMETLTITLTPEQRDILHALSQGTGKPILALIDEALEGLQGRVRPSFVHGTASNDVTGHSAKEMVDRVKEALATGQHGTARQLAQNGAKQHPGDDELEAFARVLAPPTGGVATPVAPDVRAARQANKRWIKAHWQAYRGNWIALQAGKLLHASPSFDDVVEHLGDLCAPDLLLTKIA